MESSEWLRGGVRSSRIRSINGEVIVMSNSALTNGIISNYAQMEKRRLCINWELFMKPLQTYEIDSNNN